MDNLFEYLDEDGSYEGTRPSSTRTRSYNGGYMDFGKQAEETVLRFLKGRPEVIGVDDFRDLRPLQEADVDCSIKTSDGRVTLAEIKGDKWLGKSANVLFEVLRINHTAPPDRAVTLGWSARSPATYFLYYAPTFRAIYQFRASELRERVQEYTQEVRDKTRLDYVKTDAIKSTVNILLPYERCKDICQRHWVDV